LPSSTRAGCSSRCHTAAPWVHAVQGAAVWQRDGHVIAAQHAERPGFVDAVSRMTRLPLIPGAGSLVVRDADGVALGAVGVSGATPEQDRACAEAGLAGLTS
jgi:uncharacterized protein GlcG (DUF336 family)